MVIRILTDAIVEKLPPTVDCFFDVTPEGNTVPVVKISQVSIVDSLSLVLRDNVLVGVYSQLYFDEQVDEYTV